MRAVATRWADVATGLRRRDCSCNAQEAPRHSEAAITIISRKEPA
jgi:hypothetical protein